MKIIGVTGNVASGKNTVVEIFTKSLQNIAVFDADFEARKLLKNKEIIQEISNKISNDIIEYNHINHQKLGSIVFNNKQKLMTLENIIHPKIKQKRVLFINKSEKENKDFVILNIPLLFEKNLHHSCDKTILIVCDEQVKKQRFLLRAKHYGLSIDEREFYQKLRNQNTDFQNANIADFIIENNGDLLDLSAKVKNIAKKI